MELKKFSKSRIFQIILVILPFLLIGLVFSKAVFVFFMIIVAIGLAFAILFFPPLKHIGIELVTFTTILVGFVWGPESGMTVGFFLLILHLIIGRYALGTYLIWTIPEYIIIGFLAGTMKGFGFATLGMYLSVAIVVINSILSFIFTNPYFYKYLPYAVGNGMFNLVMFYYLGDTILKFAS